MASKTGECQFVSENGRQRLLQELQQLGELKVTGDTAVTESLQKEAAAVAAATAAPSAISTATATTTLSSSSTTAASTPTPPLSEHGTGCLACGEDDDHANILLCEGCNAEYHTYCLDPPLRAVPTNDWFCSKCHQDMTLWKRNTAADGDDVDDGLERLISGLSPKFTGRFGEVCWAQGGANFGWWPAFIYDPRLTVGSARDLARKNLGKRHLVYFFECHDTPFAVLTSAKLTEWETGLLDDYHLGKTARSAGKVRTQSFLQALQAATLELAKPVELRMDWNHTDQPQILPSPQKKTQKIRKRPQKESENMESSSTDTKEPSRKRPKSKSKNGKKRMTKGFPLLRNSATEGPQFTTRRNLMDTMNFLGIDACSNGSGKMPLEVDGDLFVKVLRKPALPTEQLPSVAMTTITTSNSQERVPNGIESCHKDAKSEEPPSVTLKSTAKNVGFVKLASRRTSTFAQARTTIEDELVPEMLPADVTWRFFVPGLGPMTLKQEESLGPMLGFLRQTTSDANLGNGSLAAPLKVFVVDLGTIASTSVP